MQNATAAGSPMPKVALVLGASAGGVGRHVAAIARGLAARGGEIAVYGPAETNVRFSFSRTPGVVFHPVEIAAGWRPLATLRAAAALRLPLRDADVVHAHGLRAGAVCAIALGRWRAAHGRERGRHRGRERGRQHGRRPALVFTAHNAMLGRSARLLTTVLRRLARVCDASFAVSEDLVAALAPVPVELAVVAAPPRERQAIDVRSRLDVPADARLAVGVGRLHPQKGFDVLIDALALGAGSLPRVVTVIAGAGPARDALQARIAKAGVDVRLLGARDDVADLLDAADVVVMPSRWEGWPLLAAEALRAARPLVATRVGGLPSLVGDAGMLVPPDDPRALADALRQVLSDRALAGELAARAARRATTLPTEDDVTAQLFACYQRVFGASSAAAPGVRAQ